MGSTRTKAEFLARIEAGRADWRALLEEIGEGRMEQPGPMGEWTFKDLTAHLAGWRERGVAIFAAKARDETPPPPPWPAHLTADDAINDWIYARNRDRPLREVLAYEERVTEAFVAAIAALSDEDVTTPGRFPEMETVALADIDPFGHFTQEHEPDVRAWLAGR